MEQGKCLQCAKPIDPKYQFCFECIQKQKQEKQVKQSDFSEQHDELIRAIGQVNQNLYALRTIAEFFLKKKHDSKLIWIKRADAGTEKEKKGFFEIKG